MQSLMDVDSFVRSIFAPLTSSVLKEAAACSRTSRQADSNYEAEKHVLSVPFFLLQFTDASLSIFSRA